MTRHHLRKSSDDCWPLRGADGAPFHHRKLASENPSRTPEPPILQPGESPSRGSAGGGSDRDGGEG